MELTAVDVWTVVAAALVLLMTPGLAFFYGGLGRAKAALNMMLMSFVSIGIVGVVWVLWVFNMTDGEGMLGGLFANPFSDFGLQNAGYADMIGIGFGATFAIITVALISGAVADRTKFGAWVAFVPLWVTLVYAPLAYMVWGGGLLGEDGAIGSVVGEAIDFAGGTVVHINAGVAALVLALVIGRRSGFGKDSDHRAHNIPFVMLGAAILWFGWFGFNGGAAGTAEEAGLIWVNTLVAPGAAMLGWGILDRVSGRKITGVGSASGVVAGLVAITPACANVSPVGAIIIGLIAGAASALAVNWKYTLGYDDSLDVVGVHLVAGLVGTIALGFFALDDVGAAAGLFYGGGLGLLWTQIVATLVTIVYTAVVTFIIAIVLHKTIGMRVSAEVEEAGLDRELHAESAYDYLESLTKSPALDHGVNGAVPAPEKGTDGTKVPV